MMFLVVFWEIRYLRVSEVIVIFEMRLLMLG